MFFLYRPNAFAVITPSRVFNLISESSAEMHMWIGGMSIEANVYMYVHVHVFTNHTHIDLLPSNFQQIRVHDIHIHEYT